MIWVCCSGIESSNRFVPSCIALVASAMAFNARVASRVPLVIGTLGLISSRRDLDATPSQGYYDLQAREPKNEDAEARRACRRQRLAEADLPPKGLSMREERAAQWALLDLPPIESG
jgi:hypothetical protein